MNKYTFFVSKINQWIHIIIHHIYRYLPSLISRVVTGIFLNLNSIKIAVYVMICFLYKHDIYMGTYFFINKNIRKEYILFS